MRQEFIETESREEAEERCPWASVIVKVVGGYLAVESHEDFNIWEKQK